MLFALAFGSATPAANGDKKRSEGPIDEDSKDAWAVALRFSAVGLEFGLAIVLGYGAGRWLDGRFGTYPYLTLLMLGLGIAVGFRELIRAAKMASRTQGTDDSGDGDES